jgi:hypothetical protein
MSDQAERAQKPNDQKGPTPPEEARADALPGVEPGHFVRLRDRALIDMPKMTPVKLFKLGWPNKFMVLDVGRDPKTGEQALKLDPCCDWMEDPDGRKKNLCGGHLAHCFEIYPDPKPRGAEDRYFGVNVAGNDLLSVEYVNGGAEESLMVRFAGQKPFSISGSAARTLARYLQERGFF